jgi:hypothetical protein
VTTTAIHWTDELARLGACAEAVTWARTYDTPAAAWAACKRGDWMLWIAGRLAGPPGDETRRPLVAADCECARLSLDLVQAGEDRSRLGIETAEAWVRGEATLAEVRAAAKAAYAAYAACAACATASRAAAKAAYAAAAAAAADAAASVAADAAASAAAAAATLRQCADIVRRHYPQPPVLEDKP